MKRHYLVFLTALSLLPVLFQNCVGGTIGGNPFNGKYPPAFNVVFKFDTYNPTPNINFGPVTSIKVCLAYVELHYVEFSGAAKDAVAVIPGSNGDAVVRYRVGHEVAADPSGAFIAKLNPPTGDVDKITFIVISPNSPAAQDLNLQCQINGGIEVTNGAGVFVADNFDIMEYLGAFAVKDNQIFGYSIQNIVDAVAPVTSDTELEQALENL